MITLHGMVTFWIKTNSAGLSFSTETLLVERMRSLQLKSYMDAPPKISFPLTVAHFSKSGNAKQKKLTNKSRTQSVIMHMPIPLQKLALDSMLLSNILASNCGTFMASSYILYPTGDVTQKPPLVMCLFATIVFSVEEFPFLYQYCYITLAPPQTRV